MTFHPRCNNSFFATIKLLQPSNYGYLYFICKSIFWYLLERWLLRNLLLLMKFQQQLTSFCNLGKYFRHFLFACPRRTFLKNISKQRAMHLKLVFSYSHRSKHFCFFCLDILATLYDVAGILNIFLSKPLHHSYLLSFYYIIANIRRYQKRNARQT